MISTDAWIAIYGRGWRDNFAMSVHRCQEFGCISASLLAVVEEKGIVLAGSVSPGIC